MLVLSRQKDESIMIGDDIELTVVDIRGDRVRIGIRAPSHVSVHRKEIYEAIRRENEQASRLTRDDVPDVPGSRTFPNDESNDGAGEGSGGSGPSRLLNPKSRHRRDIA